MPLGPILSDDPTPYRRGLRLSTRGQRLHSCEIPVFEKASIGRHGVNSRANLFVARTLFEHPKLLQAALGRPVLATSFDIFGHFCAG